ncbi:hypothetical protein C8J56DRAFT_1047631 [Mycena floridula]|nr:hypothetical protein C8J56DRAFT_1047631 [Mycena floridula]
MNDRIDVPLVQGRAIVHQGAGYPSDSEQDADENPRTSSNVASSSPLPSLTPSRAISPVSTSIKKINLDSSDEESTRASSTRMTTSYHKDPKYATLSQQGSNKPCEISDGIILPALLHDFDRKQANYCDQKDIAMADRVRKSLSCFMDNKDADHEIDNQRDELEKLEWKPFITKMKEMVLQDGWEKSTLTQLMNTKMKKGQTFRLYSTEMVFVNRLLEGTPQHQDDSQLRTIVTAGVPDVLRPHAFEIVAASYGAWSSALVAKIKKNDELGELLAASNAHVAAAVLPTAFSNPNTLQPPFQYQYQNNHARIDPNSQRYQQTQQNALNDSRYNDNNRYNEQRLPDNRYDSCRAPKYEQCLEKVPSEVNAIGNILARFHLKANGENYQPITERTALNQGRVYIPNHGPPTERSPLQRSPSAPPSKRARPTAAIVHQQPIQQQQQQAQMQGFLQGRRVSGPRRVSSEGGRGRRVAWVDSDDEEWRPNVSMPSAVLHKEFDDEDDSEEDELRSDAIDDEIT